VAALGLSGAGSSSPSGGGQRVGSLGAERSCVFRNVSLRTGHRTASPALRCAGDGRYAPSAIGGSGRFVWCSPIAFGRVEPSLRRGGRRDTASKPSGDDVRHGARSRARIRGRLSGQLGGRARGTGDSQVTLSGAAGPPPGARRLKRQATLAGRDACFGGRSDQREAGRETASAIKHPARRRQRCHGVPGRGRQQVNAVLRGNPVSRRLGPDSNRAVFGRTAGTASEERVDEAATSLARDSWELDD